MTAANIELNALPSTVECTDAEFRITVQGSNVNLVNVGLESVFLKFDEDGAIARDGFQHDGEIQLDPNDSIPLPSGSTFVRHQCLATKTTKLWYMPGAA